MAIIPTTIEQKIIPSFDNRYNSENRELIAYQVSLTLLTDPSSECSQIRLSFRVLEGAYNNSKLSQHIADILKFEKDQFYNVSDIREALTAYDKMIAKVAYYDETFQRLASLKAKCLI